MTYLYDYAGNKLRQDVIIANTLTKRTDFISNIVMVDNEPAWWLNFDKGRVIINRGAVYLAETHFTDHASKPLVNNL